MVDISGKFRTKTAPETGRRVVQLTTGDAFCYPLYYFIPSISGEYLVYHRADQSGVQLCRLNLSTGEHVQLTKATGKDTQWWPWCVPAGPGVLDHRSALNCVSREVIYFDGNVARAVHLETLEDRILFMLPDDRLATGQNCVSPDGRWFFYIHHDKQSIAEVHPMRPGTESNRHLSRGTALTAFDLNSGEQRTLVRMNAPLHHVHPLGQDQLVFSSPAMERGILITDYQGGWYTHNRTQDDAGCTTCHYCATERGIFYEVPGNSLQRTLGGVWDPHNRRGVEFVLEHERDVHVGSDPLGRLWFYESSVDEHHRQIHLLARYHGFEQNEWIKLSGKWPMYWPGGVRPLRGCQKAHHHARITPDRRWLVITAGDARTRTNHIFLLDMADVQDTQGLPWD
jgi:hypothetical protein